MSLRPTPITSPKLRAHTVKHGFFTREGGVSDGLYASLNCGPGSKDITEHVSENRARITDYFQLPQEALVTLAQQHSTRVITLDDDTDVDVHCGSEGDALVTNIPGVALGILTADCCPVLLADPQAGVIGAAHAGWKGAIGGILIYTIAAMQKLGAQRSRIIAAPGPCIGQISYEVGEEMRALFLEQDPGHSIWFIHTEKPGHFLFDLQGYIRKQLHMADILHIDIDQHNTYEEEKRFFSYRRTPHRSEPDYGRQISVIAL